ncbi:large ribosomal subunit protein bL34m [Brachyhypopomus gauderio]|uniref:large ribosomal subunit protein bL34m n=1 Tax=Brachyhypopomus gauderio TaxID=698409 RepID=UPI00404194AE
MNYMRSTCLRFCGPRTPCWTDGVAYSCGHLRSISSWVMGGCSWMDAQQRILPPRANGAGVLPSPPWYQQQVRNRKRGTEYQPNNIKRKRTHGWIKRLSSRGGIEVILRRMLKGRKSLSH